MALSQLLVQVGITGVSQVESGLSRVEKAVDKTAKKSHSAALDMGKMRMPLLEAASAAGVLAANIVQIGAVVGGVSGVGIAARFQKLEQGFTNILGSPVQAKQLLSELRQIGATTEFNTENLVEYSRVLLATGSTAKGVVREIKALTDAAAFAGLATGDVGALAINISQIRNALKPELEDLKQFATRGLSLDKIVGAAQGRTLGAGEGIRELQKMNGGKAAETILTGMEKAFGGSAARNAGTFLGVIQNLNEAFATIMLPTGKILVPILANVAGGIKAVGEGLGRVNEMTGGTAGLVFLIGGLWRAGTLLIGTIGGAIAATRALTVAIGQYAATAGVAAGRSATAALFAPGVQAGMRNAQGPVSTLKTGGRGILGTLARLGRGALGLLAGGAGILADIGLNFAGDKVGGTAGGTLKGIGTGVGLGSLGFLINPLVGTITTIAGGLIGGIKGYFDSRNQKPEAVNKDSDNLQKSADALRDIRAELIGGGQRASRIKGELEIEAIFGRILATGIG